MNQGKIFLLLLLLLATTSCNRKMAISKDEANLRKQLIGQWRNLTLHIDVMTANNTNKNVVWESNEANWEEHQKIKPIHTFFNNDNTFYSEYYDLNDSLIYHPNGKWTLKGNALTFYYEKPTADTLYFTVHIKDDVATFEGMLDWDNDGRKDDKYVGTQRKQK